MARPRSFDRDHVLHAAERQFRTSGYNGTSVDDISAATDLGRGSLSPERCRTANRSGRGLDHGAWVPLMAMHPLADIPVLQLSMPTAFRTRAPGVPYAHPTVDDYIPLFIALGAAAHPDRSVRTTVEGDTVGFSKRSFQTAL